MTGSTRYFVEIKNNQGHIHQGDPDKSTALGNLRLSPNDTFTIKGEKTSLGDLLAALIDYDEDWLGRWFDERGQYDTGHYLYQQLFGDKTPEELRTNGGAVDLRIVTDDENISRLPWMLLACRGVFLSTTGWGISHAPDSRTQDRELPPRPKILVAVPEPSDWGATEAEDHLRQLRDLLSATDLAFVDEDHFRRVASWPDFLAQLNSFQPDILYYYGHGTGDRHSTRLVFEDGRGRSMEKALPDLRNALDNIPYGPPLLAYINCCQGDAGGMLGVGRQLAEIVPAVLTNRTTALISAARAQGMAYWEAVLLRGEAPHLAVAKMRGRLGDLGFSTGDIRWMTPVLHCRYDNWRANPPLPPSRLERDPHWQLKLDRVKQFGQVFFQTHQMLMERKPRALAYLWYGSPEQGVEIFHGRLKVELEEKLNDTVMFEVTPEWPDDLVDPDRSFSDMILQAFDIDTMEHLAARIRAYGRRISGQRVLVYVRHRPVSSPLRFHHKEVKGYLRWWSHKFVPQLPENAHGLLGISYELGNPAKFHKFMTQREKLHELTLHDTVFELLDELEKVEKRDLIAFIKTHNIRLPADLQNEVLEDILNKTEGSYIKILDEMRRLESRVYREGREREREQAGDEGDYGDMY